MTSLQKLTAVTLLLVSLSGWAAQAGTSYESAMDDNATQLLQDGSQLLDAKKSPQAIEDFDRVIALYENAYRGQRAKMYSARSTNEALSYATTAANEKRLAKVVSPNWAYGYYMKAYVLEDLGRFAEAKTLLQRAVELAPRNSQFLSELATVYSHEKNWPEAMRAFQEAQTQTEFSPPNLKNGELARAWRGQAFVYAEQGQYDEATRLYRECLALNSQDAIAQNELRYVETRRAQQGGGQTVAGGGAGGSAGAGGYAPVQQVQQAQVQPQQQRLQLGGNAPAQQNVAPPAQQYRSAPPAQNVAGSTVSAQGAQSGMQTLVQHVNPPAQNVTGTTQYASAQQVQGTQVGSASAQSGRGAPQAWWQNRSIQGSVPPQQSRNAPGQNGNSPMQYASTLAQNGNVPAQSTNVVTQNTYIAPQTGNVTAQYRSALAQNGNIAALSQAGLQAALMSGDAGTYEWLNPSGNPSGVYYQLNQMSNGAWVSRVKLPDQGWTDTSCGTNCTYRASTANEVRQYFAPQYLQAFDVSCIQNTAMVFCRYAVKNSPAQSGHLVVALVTGRPVQVQVQRVDPTSIR